MKQQETKFREALIEVLDDDDGINADGYALLMAFARDTMPGVCSDIEKAVDCANNRVFLPSSHELRADTCA